MAKGLLRTIVLVLLACFEFSALHAQDDVQTFRNFQFSFNRVSQAWMKNNDTLRKVFEAKGLKYPPSDIYIRSFKSQNEMELWARDSDSAEYT